MAALVDPGMTGRRPGAADDVGADPFRVRSLKEAAERANLSVFTLRRLIRLGVGPKVIRLSERRLGIRDGDFRAWLETRATV